MNVLVACEYSGIVRDAFLAHGHAAGLTLVDIPRNLPKRL